MTPTADAAPAKINLALSVTGRRHDGYHLIDTLAVFANAGDAIEAEPADGLTLEIRGPFAGQLANDETNLVLRAARALQDAARGGGIMPGGIAGGGARLVLDKRLPVASGIGGGSADAAATLRALDRLWDLRWPPQRLAAVGVRLGADVPMCLQSRPLRARGIGEEITLLPGFPALDLVLANPGGAVSTKEVFAGLAGRHSRPLPDPGRLGDADAVADYVAATGNDLEAAACRLEPRIADVIAAIGASAGCRVARMSGSGATCFGLYRTGEEAAAAAASLQRFAPSWWVAACRTGAGG